MSPSDGQLLERFTSGGDQAAFEELVRRHGPMVMGVAGRLLGDRHDAEDAFQATFMVLSRRAGELRQAGSVGSWLYGVALRVAMKARRAAAARDEHERRAAAMSEAKPDADASWAALRPVLDEELARLPGKYREPLVLCYLQGRTNDEAAAELGWTKGTVSGQLARAREMLRERLVRRGVALSAAALATLVLEKSAAAVPGALAASTVKAAALAAAGKMATAGLISAQAAALTEGVLKTMFWMKVKLVAGIVFAAAAVGAGLPAAVHAVRAEEASRDAAPKPAVIAGLEISVRPAKTPFGGRDALAFAVSYKNVSDKPKDLEFESFMGSTTLYGMSFTVENAQTKAVLRSGQDRKAILPMMPTQLVAKNLAAGESFEAVVQAPGAGKAFWQEKVGGQREKAMLPLAAGKYRLTVEFDAGDLGKAGFGPLNFEVQAIDAAAEKAAEQKAVEAAKAYVLEQVATYKKINTNDEFWKAFKPEDMVKNPPRTTTADGRNFTLTFRAPTGKPGLAISITVFADADGKLPYGGNQGNAGFSFENEDPRAPVMIQSAPVMMKKMPDLIGPPQAAD
jgi:RNA polymerase sigma factor (sigma-70 family)